MRSGLEHEASRHSEILSKLRRPRFIDD
jgi:hypothetical protein